MAFAASVTVYDNGPLDPKTGDVVETKGNLITEHADVVIDKQQDSWRGTFLTSVPLQLGGLYWLETKDKQAAMFTVTAASNSEVSFKGSGPFPTETPADNDVLNQSFGADMSITQIG